MWRRGSVIWLLDPAASALANDPGLDAYSGFAEDSGEGGRTEQAAIEAVAVDVISAALFARFRSRREHILAAKILSAMRGRPKVLQA